MQRISLINVAHNLIRDVLHPGDIAIDATIGNGHDTMFLIEQVRPAGFLVLIVNRRPSIQRG